MIKSFIIIYFTISFYVRKEYVTVISMDNILNMVIIIPNNIRLRQNEIFLKFTNACIQELYIHIFTLYFIILCNKIIIYIYDLLISIF